MSAITRLRAVRHSSSRKVAADKTVGVRLSTVMQRQLRRRVRYTLSVVALDRAGRASSRYSVSVVTPASAGHASAPRS
jgi:hypothetical protein